MRENKTKILSLDAETNGLYGDAFSIAVILMDKETGEEEKTFLARCPVNGKIQDFVKDNVLPAISSVKETHKNYKDMLKDFISFFMENKQDADVVVHMGTPVESKLFIDAFNMDLMGMFDGPYPLVDICTHSAIWDSVDKYNKEHGIVVPECSGGTHNPLYDCYAAALAYRHIEGYK